MTEMTHDDLKRGYDRMTIRFSVFQMDKLQELVRAGRYRKVQDAVRDAVGQMLMKEGKDAKPAA